MPFWWKKPTIDDQVIELKMSSSTLNRQYKKCESQALDYQKKMKAVCFLVLLLMNRKSLREIMRQLEYMQMYLLKK